MSTLEQGQSFSLPANEPDLIRRKQVRDAQRAYRFRQKSLVDSLKYRVSHLEHTLENIKQAVNAVDGQVVRSKVSPPPPTLMQTLDFLCQQISMQIEQSKQTKDATGDNSCNGGAGGGKEFDEKLKDLLSQSESPPPTSPTRNSRSQLPIIWDPKDPASDFWPLFFGSHNALLPSITPLSATNSTNCLLAPNYYRDIPDRTVQYPASPFTQKVYYACAQSGHRFLCDLRLTDKQIWPEFGLVLEHVPRYDIISYFQRVLKESPCAPVEDPRFPFISLGGAGTHFLPASPVGAHQSPGLQRFQMTNGVWEIGCQEEYFDVEDVERYLNFNGIRLSGQRNFSGGTFDPGTSELTRSDIIDPRPINATDPVLFVEEQTLIEELSLLCICLGCVAGFRRRDVEHLIQQNIKQET